MQQNASNKNQQRSGKICPICGEPMRHTRRQLGRPREMHDQCASKSRIDRNRIHVREHRRQRLDNLGPKLYWKAEYAKRQLADLVGENKFLRYMLAEPSAVLVDLFVECFLETAPTVQGDRIEDIVEKIDYMRWCFALGDEQSTRLLASALPKYAKRLGTESTTLRLIELCCYELARDAGFVIHQGQKLQDAFYRLENLSRQIVRNAIDQKESLRLVIALLVLANLYRSNAGVIASEKTQDALALVSTAEVLVSASCWDEPLRSEFLFEIHLWKHSLLVEFQDETKSKRTLTQLKQRAGDIETPYVRLECALEEVRHHVEFDGSRKSDLDRAQTALAEAKMYRQQLGVVPVWTDMQLVRRELELLRALRRRRPGDFRDLGASLLSKLTEMYVQHPCEYQGRQIDQLSKDMGIVVPDLAKNYGHEFVGSALPFFYSDEILRQFTFSGKSYKELSKKLDLSMRIMLDEDPGSS